MATSQDKGTAIVTLRLPRPLHQQLRAMADAERRSLNAQLVHLLEQATAEREEEQ
jgi:hypothetical protein